MQQRHNNGTTRHNNGAQDGSTLNRPAGTSPSTECLPVSLASGTGASSGRGQGPAESGGTWRWRWSGHVDGAGVWCVCVPTSTCASVLLLLLWLLLVLVGWLVGGKCRGRGAGGGQPGGERVVGHEGHAVLAERWEQLSLRGQSTRRSSCCDCGAGAGGQDDE